MNFGFTIIFGELEYCWIGCFPLIEVLFLFLVPIPILLLPFQAAVTMNEWTWLAASDKALTNSRVQRKWRKVFTLALWNLSVKIYQLKEENIFNGGWLMCIPASPSLLCEPRKFPAKKNSKYGHNVFLWSWLNAVYMCSANMAEKAREDDGEFSFHLVVVDCKFPFLVHLCL